MVVPQAALMLLNQAPSFAKPAPSNASSSSLDNYVTQTTGAFNFGGASTMTPLFIIGGIVAAIYFLRK